MARISVKDLEKYGGGGGSSYFSLKNDKDVARVRILLNKPDDIEDYIYGVHDVIIGDRHRNVNCLRAYNEPVDKCPFCAEGKKVFPKIYVPLYNEDAGEIQIWERGKGFMSTLSSFLARYSNPSVVSHQVEIERNGKAGDMKTTYGLYEVGKDDKTVEDFDEVPEILGSGMLLDKSVDDMNYYLDEGEFPPDDNSEEEPVRRRSRRDESEEEPEQEKERPRRRSESGSSGRRTPASSRGGRRSSF